MQQTNKPFLKKIIRNKVFWLLLIFLSFIWLNNTSLFSKKSNSPPQLLAHRGVHQTFYKKNIQWDTNTARIIYPPQHEYLENSIPSIEAAFRYGADTVEFDIRITKDKKLAVFHDFLVDYRTDGKGLVADFTMEELRQLDIGYGYTADKGKTYPFRGKGIGILPSIDDIFNNFPGKKFLIHIKDPGKEVGFVLLDYLQKLESSKKEQISNISVYGNDLAIKLIQEHYPEIKVFTKSRIIKALLIYELLGWTGYVPKTIRNMELPLTSKIAKFLWGWPHKFFNRMEKVNTRIILIKYDNITSGFDTKESLNQIPDNFTGAIWTNRIDKVGPYLKNKLEVIKNENIKM